MELSNLLNPVGNRFNYAEGNKPIKNAIIGTLKTFIRGGIIGGFVGGIASGGEGNSFLYLAGIGAAIDGTQDALRKINLGALHRDNYNQYIQHKNKYLNFLEEYKLFIKEYI